MRNVIGRGVAKGLVGLAAALAVAAPAAAVDSSQNAALRYWRAWSVMSPELQEAVKSVPQEDLAVAGAKLPDGVRQRVASEGPGVVALLRRAAAMPECDFANETELGPGMLLPQLGPMRVSARLLAIDARMALDAGNADDAVESLVAGYRVSLHATEGNALIGSLVGAACFKAVDAVAGDALARNALNAAARARLREALAGFDPADPFRVHASFVEEGTAMVGWLRGLASGSGGAARVREALKPLGAEDAVVAALADADDAAMGSYIDLFAAFYRHMLAAWDAPDAATKLAELEGRVAEGAYGPITLAMAGAVTKAYEAHERGKAMVQAATRRVAP